MKHLVFDTGPLITLVTNNLLWVLRDLKKYFKGEFLIPKDVKQELIDKPLRTKKFKFEAIFVMDYIKEGIIKISEKDVLARTNLLLNLANKIYRTKEKNIQIVGSGEISVLALASLLKAEACVIDERTTRVLIENPKRLLKILEKKLHMRVFMDSKMLRNFQKEVGKIKVIRSSELLLIAYELGLLDHYLQDGTDKKTLLDSILWGAKLRGCAISNQEIEEAKSLEIS